MTLHKNRNKQETQSNEESLYTWLIANLWEMQ